MIDKPLESDWKSFSKHVPDWRERYLARKNKEIVAMLENNGKTPTEIFWDTKQFITDEAKILTSCLDGHSRSKMTLSLQLMFRYGLIGEADLAEFSEELREIILSINREFGNREDST